MNKRSILSAVAGITGLFCASVLLVTAAHAQSAGDLDESFGTSGAVLTPFGVASDQAHAVVIQPEGKIVAIGNAYMGGRDQFALVRYLPDGRIDSTFGNSGKTTTIVGTASAFARSAGIQTTGNIVVGGHGWHNGEFEFNTVRYLPDGTLDTSYGTGGIAVIGPGPGNDIAYSMVVQNDDKIVQAGVSPITNVNHMTAVRYLNDGSPDSSFGTNGVVTTLVGSGSIARGVVVQPDGKVTLGGSASINGVDRLALLRLLPDGTPDSSFGSNGVVTTSVGANAQIAALALDGDGLVAVGTMELNGTNDDIFVARYLADGTLDPAFGSNGIVTTDVTPVDYAHAVLIQPNGRIVVAGTTRGGSDFDLTVLRYQANGALDSAFGDNGIRVVESPSNDDSASAVAMQNYDKIVAVGTSMVANKDHFSVVRLHALTLNNSSPSTVPAASLPQVPVAALTPAPSPLTYRAANKQVTLRWRAVEGAASYVVTTTRGSQRCDTTAISCVIPRLRNGKAYTYLVYSVNADGVRSETATRISARPGFVVKRTTLKAKRTLKLSSIVTTPSKGAKTWRVTSGGCRIQGDRLVAPTKRGTCRLRLATTKRGSYPAMSTTIKLTITR